MRAYRLPGTALVCDDNIRTMQSLAAQAVRPDLIVGSPPYSLDVAYDTHDDHATYQAYLDTVGGFASAAAHVAHDQTRLVVNVPLDTNLGGKQPVYTDWVRQVKAAGWQYQTSIVWQEGNIKSRTAWGSWRSPSAPFVTAPVEMVAVFYREQWKRTDKRGQTIERDDFLAWTLGSWAFSNTATAKRNGHPAAYDEELPRRLISLYSFPGDLVLAPWNGTGTDTKVARDLGRRSIGLDVSPRYTYRAYRRLLGDPTWPTAEPPACSYSH